MGAEEINRQVDWDYSSEYCDGCAELGLTTCSCEPDGFEEESCYECGAEEDYCDNLCYDCYNDQFKDED